MRAGARNFSQKSAKWLPEEDYNNQKTSRDGADQKRVKRAHSGGGQETRTGGMIPLGTRRDCAHGRGQQGGKRVSRNCGGRM